MTPPRRTTRSRTKRSERPARSGAVRLQRLLAESGLASRREAERWIEAGRVAVNGQVVRTLGTRADPDQDRIAVDGRPLRRPRARTTYLLHKPRGVVTTTRDPHARKTVLDLVPARGRLYPVGRLDAGSEGLLLVTNDGRLAQVLTHPSFEVPRTYRVSVEGRLGERALARLRRGIAIDGRRVPPREVKVVRWSPDRTVVEITLHEGRRRQIRQMMRAVGHRVQRLVRTRFGPIRLGRLPPGASRPLTAAECRALERLVREAAPGPTDREHRRT